MKVSLESCFTELLKRKLFKNTFNLTPDQKLNSLKNISMYKTDENWIKRNKYFFQIVFFPSNGQEGKQ